MSDVLIDLRSATEEITVAPGSRGDVPGVSLGSSIYVGYGWSIRWTQSVSKVSALYNDLKLRARKRLTSAPSR